MKLNAFFAALSGQVKSGLRRFAPAAAYSAAFFCVMAWSLYSYSDISIFLMPSLALACALAVLARLILENRGLEARAAAITFAVTLPLGAMCCWPLERFSTSRYALMCYFGVFIAALLAILWLLYKDADGERLFAHLTAKAVFCGAVATALMLGLILCIAAFTELIYSPKDTQNLYLLSAALSFAVVWFNLFLSYLPKSKEDIEISKVYRALVANVALPVYLLLLAILYGYIIKMVATWTMPVGTMNWFGSIALLCYVLLWLGIRFQDSALVRFFTKYGGWAMIPVLVAQVIGVVIRLCAYGLTSARYISLVCLALGITALIFTLLGKSLRPLFLAACAAALIVTVTPLNAIDVPVFEQQQRLKSVLAENGMYDGERITPSGALSGDDKETIASCYDNLRSNAPDLEQNGFLKQAAFGGFEETYGFEPGGSSYYDRSDSGYYYCKLPEVGLDISKYDRMAYLENVWNVSGQPFVFELSRGGERLNLDLAEYLAALAADNGTGDHELESMEFEIQGGGKLVLTSVFVNYYDGEISGVVLDGYWLYNEKDISQAA